MLNAAKDAVARLAAKAQEAGLSSTDAFLLRETVIRELDYLEGALLEAERVAGLCIEWDDRNTGDHFVASYPRSVSASSVALLHRWLKAREENATLAAHGGLDDAA